MSQRRSRQEKPPFKVSNVTPKDELDSNELVQTVDDVIAGLQKIEKTIEVNK
jgi:hypothetical protein